MSENTYITNDTHPWDDKFPFRITKTSEFRGSSIDDYSKKRIFIRNTEGIIDTDSKYWSLVKVLKSTTNVVHWLIKMHNQYYVASQFNMYLVDEVVAFYESDRRGRYDNLNPVVIYRSYVDIESATDKFSQEYMAMLINERHPDVEHIINKEIEK